MLVRKDSAAADSMAQQYLELREKQYDYFAVGLQQDWEKIERVRGALTTVANASHIKKAWRCNFCLCIRFA